MAKKEEKKDKKEEKKLTAEEYQAKRASERSGKQDANPKTGKKCRDGNSFCD